MAEVIARGGYKIAMLKEVPGVSSPDVTILGIPAELKRTKSAGNIIKYAKKAVQKQGAKILLFQFDSDTGDIRIKLSELERNGYKVLYFFTGENKIHKNGNIQIP